MKLTAKIIPIDLRRRRALDRAHAQEVMAARAAFGHPDIGYEPQALEWPRNSESRQRVVILHLHSPTHKHDGETS